MSKAVTLKVGEPVLLITNGRRFHVEYRYDPDNDIHTARLVMDTKNFFISSVTNYGTDTECVFHLKNEGESDA